MRTIGILLTGLVLFALTACATESSSASTPTATTISATLSTTSPPTAAATQPPPDTAISTVAPTATFTPAGPRSNFGDGTWQVGKDITAGTYRTTGGEGCYWARVSDFSGSLQSIQANENARGPAVVSISSTDAGFTSRRCGTWELSDKVKPATTATQITDGTWRVGVDIAPGTYRTSTTERCYWARLSGFSGTLTEILANDNPRAQTIVTISPTDAGFISRGCGSWSM